MRSILSRCKGVVDALISSSMIARITSVDPSRHRAVEGGRNAISGRRSADRRAAK
jgi:hypothetical protein